MPFYTKVADTWIEIVDSRYHGVGTVQTSGPEAGCYMGVYEMQDNPTTSTRKFKIYLSPFGSYANSGGGITAHTFWSLGATPGDLAIRDEATSWFNTSFTNYGPFSERDGYYNTYTHNGVNTASDMGEDKLYAFHQARTNNSLGRHGEWYLPSLAENYFICERKDRVPEGYKISPFTFSTAFHSGALWSSTLFYGVHAYQSTAEGTYDGVTAWVSSPATVGFVSPIGLWSMRLCMRLIRRVEIA